MSFSVSQSTRLALAFLAIAMVLCAPAAHTRATGNSVSPVVGAPALTKSDLDNPNLILFSRGPVDTTVTPAVDDSTLASGNAASAQAATFGKQLRVIQFAGPTRRQWLHGLKATGVEIIGYVPNNAYIIRGGARELARVAKLVGKPHLDALRPVRWAGHLEPVQKLDRVFDDWLSREDATVDVEIQLIEGEETERAIELIKSVAVESDHAPARFLKFAVLAVTVPAAELMNIARLDEVLFIGPAFEPVLHDELSVQIVAGNLNAEGTEPTGPGYLAWLAERGLNFEPDFLIDITDTGIDKGSTSASSLHPGFLNGEGQSRVLYSFDYTGEAEPKDESSHGTFVASLVAGANRNQMKDGQGYLYGLGVDPTARIGASRIFTLSRTLPPRLDLNGVVTAASAAGAAISNNSWGNGSNRYDLTAQKYDALARDANPDLAGNQEMVFVFSAGNKGAGGHVSSPGTAKNVISVAASESFRPDGIDSCDLDGFGAIGPDGADSALDILRYSSGGPTAELRVKPDIAAPGSHIFGAFTTAPGAIGEGLCPGLPKFRPPNQRLYTWSSGTSLAAPHISGAAGLVRKYFTAHNLLGDGRAPSLAMTKAYLMNSASYMTGENAGGDLPSERQGAGLVNLSRSFDDAKRALVDQTHLFTESGQVFELRGAIADRSRPLRITLAYTDAPGMVLSSPQVNNLDLEISINGVTIYRGNNFINQFSVEGGEADNINNVESIILPPEAIPEGVAGNFTVRVIAANIAGDGVPGNENDLDQDFALVVYNVTEPVTAPPPEKVPVITEATFVKKVLTIKGREFSSAARVEINGESINHSFEFDAATNSLRIKKKAKKLKLLTANDNQIVVIEGNKRSLAFTLTLQ